MKQKLVEMIIAKIEEELRVLVTAAKAAHEAATHEESKAEDQHDTRGLEASYLAGAQAQRAGELQQLLIVFKNLKLKDLPSGSSIAVGAMVEVLSENRKAYYFLAPGGGGMSFTIEGKRINLISPQSPLGEELVGRKVGHTIEVETKGAIREYEILSVT